MVIYTNKQGGMKRTLPPMAISASSTKFAASSVAASIAWGENAVSSCYKLALTAETRVLALLRARCLRHFPYLERTPGVPNGVRRGPVGPP